MNNSFKTLLDYWTVFVPWQIMITSLSSILLCSRLHKPNLRHVECLCQVTTTTGSYALGYCRSMSWSDTLCLHSLRFLAPPIVTRIHNCQLHVSAQSAKVFWISGGWRGVFAEDQTTSRNCSVNERCIQIRNVYTCPLKWTRLQLPGIVHASGAEQPTVLLGDIQHS